MSAPLDDRLDHADAVFLTSALIEQGLCGKK